VARLDDKRDNVFLVLWTLSVLATTLLFLFYLGVRVRTIELGYELGKAQADLARLREVERVLELELSAHETPERIDLVSRTLFGMEEPAPERIISAGPEPEVATDRESDRKQVAEGPEP
jgi:cell division protein FtsL